MLPWKQQARHALAQELLLPEIETTSLLLVGPLKKRQRKEIPMARCETCGNDYDKAFEVIMAGTSYTFDSFECAIQTLAPTCNHCGCRIIGHGVEADDTLYCCAHCAGKEGVGELQDRA